MWDVPITGPGVEVSRETSSRYWEHGGHAVRVLFPSSEPDYFVAPPVARVPFRAQGYLNFFARVTTLRGRVHVWARISRGALDYAGNPAASFPFAAGTSLEYHLPQMSGSLVTEVDANGFPIKLPEATNIELNTPENIGFQTAWDLNKLPLYDGTIELFVSPAHGLVGTPVDTGPVECIIGGFQVTIGNLQLPLLEGNGGVRLHQAANARVGLYGAPAPVVSANLLDLAVADGLRFPYAPIQVGAPITIDDPESAVSVSSRVVGWRRDWFNRTLPEVQLSNDRQDITRVLATRSKGARRPSTLVPPGTRALAYEP